MQGSSEMAACDMPLHWFETPFPPAGERTLPQHCGKRGRARPSNDTDVSRSGHAVRGDFGRAARSAAPRVGGLVRLVPVDQSTTGATTQLCGTIRCGRRSRASLLAVEPNPLAVETNPRQPGQPSPTRCRGPAARERRYASTVRSPSEVRAIVWGVSSRAVPYSRVASTSSMALNSRHQRSGR